MNHGELKVPSPFGRPSSDTQNLVLSELSLFIPPQNIENKILGLQYIGARLQYIGAPKCYWLYILSLFILVRLKPNTYSDQTNLEHIQGVKQLWSDFTIITNHS